MSHHLRRAAAELIGASVRSNGSILNDDCSSLTGWTDADTGNGVSSQTTFSGESVFKLDGGASYNASNAATRYRAPTAPTNRAVLTFDIYHDSLGNSTASGVGACNLYYCFDTHRNFIMRVWNDKLTVRDSSSVDQTVVSSSIIGSFYTITVDIDFSSSPATCDVYINDVLVGSGLNCDWSYALIATGAIETQQISRESSPYVQRISYVNNILVGDDLA